MTTNELSAAMACNTLRTLSYDMCNYSRSVESMLDKGLNAPDLLAAMRLNVEEQLSCLSALEPVVIEHDDISE